MVHPASQLENHWFTVEEIDETTFSIAEYGQWMKVHSYLFVGSEQALLVDSGLGVGNIRNIVEALTPLPVRLVTTHAHWDHTGGHDLFDGFSAHKLEQDWIEGGYEEYADKIVHYLMKDPLTKEPPPEFDRDTFRPIRMKVSQFHEDGDTVELGGRSLQIIHTPGHSPGHICVYEEESGYLVTADLLYKGVLLSGLHFSIPEDYRQSLHKLYALPHISKLLPGHGQLNIANDYLKEAVEAFDYLAEQNLLHKDSGIHTFERIKVQL